MFHADDYLNEQETEHERNHKARRDMVKIYELRDYGYLVKVRDHATALGANYDQLSDGHTNILAVCGTFFQLACVQSFIDGMYAI